MAQDVDTILAHMAPTERSLAVQLIGAIVGRGVNQHARLQFLLEFLTRMDHNAWIWPAVCNGKGKQAVTVHMVNGRITNVRIEADA